MSIIYDALQKTQRKRMNTDESNPRKRTMSYSTYIIIINILLIICLLAFAKIYNTIWDSKAKLLSAQTQLKDEQAATLKKDKFILSGMFISKEEKFVVINNKSLHEGDQIDGVEIVKISPSKVILSKNEEFFTLKSNLGPN